MLRKAFINQHDHFTSDFVGREAGARGQHSGAIRSEGFAVVGVKIPLAAKRLAVLHQHAVTLAQLAVKVLQPERLAALGVGCEVANRRVKVAVIADFQAQPRVGHHCRD